MKLTSKITNNKLYLILFLIVIILGLFVRFDNFSEVGYWNDDQATLPAGLMWFYPQPYFPGLNYGNPPLGDMIIGYGCTLSGEDFSGASQVRPFFYPDRFNLLGTPLANSDTHCHLPMYLFGLIFFALILIFSFTFFGRSSAFFLATFFAFSPLILLYSRWIKSDIIFWTFVISFLFFLLKFYYSTKKEYLYLIFSAFFLGLAFATKFTAAMLFIFSILIILEKYKKQLYSILKLISKRLNLTLFQNKEYVSPKKLIKSILVFSITFIFIMLIPFKLNYKNLLATQQSYQQINQNLGALKISFSNLFLTLKQFILSLNSIETLIFIFSIYVLIRIILKKDKNKLEKFTLILLSIFVLTALLFPVISPAYRAFPFLLSFIFLFALVFSNEKYSIFNTFKIKNKKTFFTVFIIIYLVFTSFTAFSSSPYFQTKNNLVCPITDHSLCDIDYTGFRSKTVANFLSPLLNENETFTGDEGVTFFYIKPEQGMADYQFGQVFQQQVGREPNFLEKIQYFRPNNQDIRYLILYPDSERESEESKAFKQQYAPLEILKIKNNDVAVIYDLRNLRER